MSRHMTNDLKQSERENLEHAHEQNKSQVQVVDPFNESIETIAALHARMERRVGPHQRAVESFTSFFGRPRFLYLILLFVVLWIAINLLLPAYGIRSFDPPPFSWLQGTVGLSALLMTIIILITENRHSKHTDQRRHLDLQVTLLVEQKVTKVIDLLEQIRRDSPNLQDRYDPQAEALKVSIDPHEALSTLSQRLKEVSGQLD